MSDRWPALMLRETAAEYCDMSPVQFDRQCPVAPVDQGWRGLRWKRMKLDAWIENLPERPRKSSDGLDGGEAAGANASPQPSPEARRAASLARI